MVFGCGLIFVEGEDEGVERDVVVMVMNLVGVGGGIWIVGWVDLGWISFGYSGLYCEMILDMFIFFKVF